MRARRALLYMPGDDLHKIQKATTLGVDCICMDMEDGVAYTQKQAARETITKALKSLDFGRSERLARINPVGSGLEFQDLEMVLPAHPDGIVIPKVETGEEIFTISQRLAAEEKMRAWPIGEIILIAVVETARGVINLGDIAAADRRLRALILGAEDLAGDIGATRSEAGWEVFYARSALVLHAAAQGLQAIDMVYIDFHDDEGLHREAQNGAQMGFTGKQIIHPNQVAPTQEAFTPSDEAIARAQHLLQAFEEHQQAGKGAFALEGKMIDAPIIKAAEHVLTRARAAGKL